MCPPALHFQLETRIQREKNLIKQCTRQVAWNPSITFFFGLGPKITQICHFLSLKYELSFWAQILLMIKCQVPDILTQKLSLKKCYLTLSLPYSPFSHRHQSMGICSALHCIMQCIRGLGWNPNMQCIRRLAWNPKADIMNQAKQCMHWQPSSNLVYSISMA